MKKAQSNPGEIARKTLETLAKHKFAPTPQNYKKIYADLSGEPEATFDDNASLLKSLTKYIEFHPRYAQQGVVLQKAIKSQDWDRFFQELKSGSLPVANDGKNRVIEPEPEPRQSVMQMPAGVYVSELFSGTLESIFGNQGGLSNEIFPLVAQINEVKSPEEAAMLGKKLQDFCSKVKVDGHNKKQVQAGLLRLLRLFAQNVDGIVEDDSWIQGQVAIVQDIIDNPEDKATLSDAEKNLRNAIVGQNLIKSNVLETKQQLKGLMTNFIDQLGDVSSSTDDYHSKISAYTDKVNNVTRLDELHTVLEEIKSDTAAIYDNFSRSRSELLETKRQTLAAEEKIKSLEQELASVSVQVYQDQLTGALNRRGMDEAFARELGLAEENASPLSIALLDIDNFKQLNDSLGHQAGDHALIHLCNVIRESILETDSVSRYGGEEFVIIMPDTPLQKGSEKISALQRELTKKFFLEGNQRVLLTFSAGVAERIGQETQDELISRADEAMYTAKKTGKNRVISAEPPEDNFPKLSFTKAAQ